MNATTGAAGAFNPSPDGDVWSLALVGDKLYAGGYFSNIGGAARSNLAGLDTATALLAASVTVIEVDAGSSFCRNRSFTSKGAFVSGQEASSVCPLGLLHNYLGGPKLGLGLGYGRQELNGGRILALHEAH